MASKIRLSVTIDSEMHEILTSIAELSDTSVAAVMRDYLNIGRESLKMIASTMRSARDMEEEQKERVRRRLDEAAARVVASGEEVIRIQREIAAEIASAPRAAPTGADSGDDARASVKATGPRIVTRGFPGRTGGGRKPSKKGRGA